MNLSTLKMVGRFPALVTAPFCFDCSFMVWSLLGVLACCINFSKEPPNLWSPKIGGDHVRKLRARDVHRLCFFYIVTSVGFVGLG